MNKILLLSTLCFALPGAGQSALISYWNFNALSIATASAPGSGGVPTSITADQGSGTVSLTGWGGTVDDFAGSTILVLAPDLAEESLSLVSGGVAAGPFPGNGSFIELTGINFPGMENPVITFATRGTATGFNNGIWSYSIGGGTFTTVPVNTATATGGFTSALLDLSSENALDGASGVTFRYTLSGATSNSGNNRIDNLQINASPVPEPGVAMLGLLAGLGLWIRRRSL